MTHLLHTSSLLGHIWAARKSIFCACVVERSRHCRDNMMMSSFLLSPFFCTIFYIRTRTSNSSTEVSSSSQGQNISPVLHGYFRVFFIQGTFSDLLNNEPGTDLRICISVLSHTQTDINTCINTAHVLPVDLSLT